MLTKSQPQPGRRQRHAGTRTCVGCGARVDKSRVRQELVRIVLVADGDGFRAHVDLGGSNVGRGSWMHSRPECLEKAASRGLARSAKARVDAEPGRLRRELHAQTQRRAASLIGSAARTGMAAVGSAAVLEALRGGEAKLLIVAKDAAAAAKHREVETAMQSGKGVAYGDKSFLGEALGRGEVGVIAVLDDGMAAAIRHTIGLSETFAPS